MPLHEELIAVHMSDPNVRTYHTKQLISTYVEEQYFRNGSEVENEFAKMVLETPGIVKLVLNPYAMTVYKAPLFSWEEVEESPDTRYGALRHLRTYVMTKLHMDMADNFERKANSARSQSNSAISSADDAGPGVRA